jgi:hypothetical protein
MSNRLNDEQSAIVAIVQRLHDADVAGDILSREANYCHMLVPMYFDPLRYPASEDGERTEDPETGEESPPRATRSVGLIHGLVMRMAGCSHRGAGRQGGNAGVTEAVPPRAGQGVVPRKGGIFKREYWQPYVPTKDNGRPSIRS